MHEYYKSNNDNFKKGMDKFLSLIITELEEKSGKKYAVIFEEIWDYYEKNLLERFPYVGGDKVSGTRNLTGAFYFVAMGEVLKRYGAAMEDVGHIMVYCYERYTQSIPGIARFLLGKFYRSPKLLNKALLKMDSKNAKNAAVNPGSFETKTQIPPE